MHDWNKTEYELYRNLAQAVYALALDAVKSRDMQKVAFVCKIAVQTQEPMSYIFGRDTPAFQITEYTNLATIRNWDDSKWDWALKELENLKPDFSKILGA